MFTPELSVAALRTMSEKYGTRIYGKYGFIDAFNPGPSWYDKEVIGINVGIILLSAENARTGNVWRWFMANAEIRRAMTKIGFVRYRAVASGAVASGAVARLSRRARDRVPQLSPP